MKLVVTEVQGSVYWLKRLKVNVDFLLLTFLCHDGATVHDQTIGWHWQRRQISVIGQIHKQCIVSTGQARLIKFSQICPYTCCTLSCARPFCDRRLCSHHSSRSALQNKRCHRHVSQSPKVMNWWCIHLLNCLL